MKKLLSIGKPINKEGQKNITGGHVNPYDPNCLANCEAVYMACHESPNTPQQCAIDLACCQSECAPPGGHVR